jgi:polyhydroxyalkanoate synthesis regulator phasin
MRNHRPKTAESIQQLKKEIESLWLEQTDSNITAVYVGMTDEQAKEHEERREKITRLREQLALLEKSE